MAFTQTQIDALKKAIAGGTLKVKYGDQEITYRSLAEMRETLSMMESEVNPTQRKSRRSVASFSSGL